MNVADHLTESAMNTVILVVLARLVWRGHRARVVATVWVRITACAALLAVGVFLLGAGALVAIPLVLAALRMDRPRMGGMGRYRTAR